MYYASLKLEIPWKIKVAITAEYYINGQYIFFVGSKKKTQLFYFVIDN